MSRFGTAGQVWGVATFMKLLPLLIALALLAGVPAGVSGQEPPATVQFAQDLYLVAEFAGTATLTIYVVGTSETCPVAFPFSVQVDTVGGTALPSDDYVAFSSQLVSFAACQAEEQVDIDLVDDFTVEPDETFTVKLSRPASLDPAITLGLDETTVTILDGDASTIHLSSIRYEADEDDGKVTVTATKSHPIAFPVDVQLSTSDGTAVAGEDYQSTSTTLSFPAGTTSVSTEITIIDDELVEPETEIFSVELSSVQENSNVRIRTLPSTVTITDDDSVTVSLSSDEYSVSEGTVTGTVEITAQVEGGPAHCPVAFPFSVHLSTLDGTAVSSDFRPDFTGFSHAILYFDACEREQTIEFPIFNDRTVERTETFRLKLERTATLDESIRLGRTEATVEIEDDDTAALSWTASTSSVGEGDGSITVSAGVASPDIPCPVAFPFSVPLSIVRNTAENSDFSRRRDHVLQFDECDLSSAAQISIVDDRLVEHTETFNVRMERAPGLDDSINWFTSEITVEITDDDHATVSFRNTYTLVREGDESVEVCVDVTQPGVAFPFFVNLLLDLPDDDADLNLDYRRSASFLEIGSRALSQCIDFLIVDDADAEASEIFTVQLQKPSGLIASVIIDPDFAEAEIEILDDDVVTVGFLDRSPLTENVWAVAEEASYRLPVRVFADNNCGVQIAFQVGLSYTDPGNAVDTSSTIPSSLDFNACQQIYAFDVDTTSVDETSEVDFTLERPSDLHSGIRLERDPTLKLKVFDAASSYLQFAEPEYIVGEAEGTAEVTVSFSDPLDQPLTLEFQVSNSTARTGSDYTQATSEVTVATGATSASHTINIIDDTKLEPTERFIVSVTPGEGSDQFDGYGLLETSVVIRDDDTATVSFASDEVVVNEGHWFQVELLVTAPEDSCDIDFPFAVSMPYTGPAGAITDGPSSPSLVSFRGCETSRVIDFRAGDDAGGSEVEFTLVAGLFSDSRFSAGEPSTVTVRILDTDPFARNPSQDFDDLELGGNSQPEGIWSDGVTMWVADPQSGVDGKIYAYNLANKERDSSKDFIAEDLAENDWPNGIWSDETTMWVADWNDDKIYAYGTTTKVRDPSREFDTLAAAENVDAAGIWSNGITMWVADPRDSKIYAYNITTKERDQSKEFNTLGDAGNDHPNGIWSDGVTMWVADGDDSKIYAYGMTTKAQDESLEFNTLREAGNTRPWGLWSDGMTMWVSDWIGGDKIYAYYMPPNALTPSPRARPTQTPVVGPGPDPEPPRPGSIKVDKCVGDVGGGNSAGSGEAGSGSGDEGGADNEISSIDAGNEISGEWEGGCPSVSRGGRMAKYYIFTLPITTAVEIALDSHLDTYLVLRSGGLSGDVVARDDDSGPGNNSLIAQTLTAGEYTIEATTFYADGVEAEFTLSVTVVPRVLYSGPVSEVAHADYAPDGPTLTVRLLPTLPRGRLEITIEDGGGFGNGTGPLGGAQTTDGSAGTVLIALPRSVWLVYDELSVEVRESGSWSTHSQSDELALLAEEATGGDFSSTLEQVPGLIENAEDASGLIASLNTLMSAASVPAATPDSSALDDIFTESHANCVSQVVVPWLTEATETTGVRVSLPVENLAGSYLSVAASFVAGGGEQGLAQLHDLLDTGEVVPSCQRPEQSEE